MSCEATERRPKKRIVCPFCDEVLLDSVELAAPEEETLVYNDTSMPYNRGHVCNKENL